MKLTKDELHEILKPASGSRMCFGAAARFEEAFQGKETAEAYQLYRRIKHGGDMFWVIHKLDYDSWWNESSEVLGRGTQLCTPGSSWEAVTCAELKLAFPWRRLKPALEKQLAKVRAKAEAEDISL